jgi:hypothetical protein
MRAGLLFVAAAVLGGLAACTYAPDFGNDKLVCGAGQTCPKGYSCASDNKCWKTGESPGGVGGSDGGTHADAGGAGGAKMDASSDVPISTDPRVGFVGTWGFTGGTVSGSCTDGSTFQRPLSGATTNDYIVINLGTTASTILAQWYCQTGWTMQLSSGNTMAVATSNQNCVQRTTDNSVTPPVTTSFTWSPMTFSFTKLTATTAMTTGHFTGPFMDSNNVMGTCDLTFSGPLTKN